MYEMIKACLIKPSKIPQFVDNNKKRIIIYTIIVILISLIAPIIMLTQVTVSDIGITWNGNKTLFNNNPSWVIEDYEFKNMPTSSYTDESSLDIVGNTLSFTILVSEDDPSFDSTTPLVVQFTKTNIKFYLASRSSSNTSNPDGVNKLSITTSFVEFYSRSYEELGLKDVNFSDQSFSGIILNSIFDNLFHKYFVIVLIFVILTCVESYFFEILFVTVICKIFYRMFKVSFGKTFVISILASLPYVVGSLLGVILNQEWIEFIGSLLTIFYATRAVIRYRVGTVVKDHIKVVKVDGNEDLNEQINDIMEQFKEQEAEVKEEKENKTEEVNNEEINHYRDRYDDDDK